MKKILLLCIAALLFGCTTPENRAIAKVSNVKITQEEFDIEVAKLTKAMVPEDYVMTDEEKVMFHSQILNNMIFKIAHTKKMDELNIAVNEELLEQQMAQLSLQYGSEEALINDIESRGYTFDEIKDEFRYQQRLSDLSQYAADQDIEVPEEDIENFYNENKETVFKQDAAVNSARHILFLVDDTNKEQALKDITEVREKIMAGMDFAEAAIQYSQGPSAPNGGQLGGFQRGQMVPEFEEVAFTIPVNQVSGPVLSQYGYHLILVEDRTEETFATLEEARTYIAQRIKVDNFFDKIYEDAKITKPDWAEESKE